MKSTGEREACFRNHYDITMTQSSIFSRRGDTTAACGHHEDTHPGTCGQERMPAPGLRQGTTWDLVPSLKGDNRKSTICRGFSH